MVSKNLEIPKKDKVIIRILSLPSFLCIIVFALIVGDETHFYFGALFVGWFVMTLFVGNLYSAYMMPKEFRQPVKFYGYYIGIQAALFFIGGILIYVI